MVLLKVESLANIAGGDAELLAQGKPASPVKSINGTDASEYLEGFSSNQEKHDPDAR